MRLSQAMAPGTCHLQMICNIPKKYSISSLALFPSSVCPCSSVLGFCGSFSCVLRELSTLSHFAKIPHPKTSKFSFFFGSHCPAMQCRVHPLITPDGLYGFPELYSGTMSRSIWANQDIKDIQKQSNTFKNIKKHFFIQELSAFPNMLAGVIKFSVQPESLSFIQ